MTTETEKQRLDRLQREAAALRAQSASAAQDAASAKKSGGMISDAKAVRQAAKSINATVSAVTGVAKAVYTVGKPVFDVVLSVGRGYMKLWNAVCRKTDKTTGERKVVRWRAMTMSALSVFVASGAVPGPIGQPSREAVWAPIADGASMAMPGSFKSNETLYLSNAQEMGGEANEFSVRGCRSIDCSDGGVNFRVRQSGAHNIWAILARGNPFYVSDAEVQTITPGTNVCSATSYGYRWRMFQQFDMYPTLLTAHCQPVFNGVAPRTAQPAPVQAPAAPAVSAQAPAA